MKDYSHLFEGVEDPRRSNATRHDLHEMLMIGLLSTLCGGEGCSDMALFGRMKEPFLRTFMRLEHGIPSHDAFSDLFNALDPQAFQGVMVRLTQSVAEQLGDVIAVDGKSVRHSFDKAKDKSPLHLVQAFAAHSRLVLGQVATDAKSNEISAMPALLQMLSLKGRIMTADAMHTQRNTARAVCDARGDYALVLKRNHKALYEDVALWFDDPADREHTDRHQCVDAGHGRIETREAVVCSNIDWLIQRHDWPGLKAIGKITATRQVGGKTTTQTRCYLLSTPLSAQRLVNVTRAHWQIENALHWVLDVTMNEDAARQRNDNGPENLAILRRIALNLARLEPSKGSMRGKFKRAAWNDQFMLQLLASSSI